MLRNVGVSSHTTSLIFLATAVFPVHWACRRIVVCQRVPMDTNTAHPAEGFTFLIGDNLPLQHGGTPCFSASEYTFAVRRYSLCRLRSAFLSSAARIASSAVPVLFK